MNDNTELTTLGEAYPKEQARVRELLMRYRELGPAGAVGAMMIEAELREADEAVISGDLPRMIAAYQSLKGCE